MFLFLTVFLVVLLSFHASAQSNSNEIFRDDFSGKDSFSTLGKWSSLDGPDVGLKFYSDNQNGSLRFFSYWHPSNVVVENGSLHLKAKKRIQADGNYTSAYVHTTGKFEFLYGEIEVRARIPSGNGLWSSLSLERSLSQNNCSGKECSRPPSFIGILDAPGDVPYNSTVGIFRRETRRVNFAHKTVSHLTDMSLDFHLYKVVWTPTKLTWYIDDQEVFHVTDTQMIPTYPLEIVMKLSLSGRYPGPPFEETGFPPEFLIDYVVVHHLKKENGVPVPSKNSNLDEEN